MQLHSVSRSIYIQNYKLIRRSVYISIQSFPLGDPILILGVAECPSKIITSFASENPATHNRYNQYTIQAIAVDMNPTFGLEILLYYVFASLYSRYSLSTFSEAFLSVLFLGSGWILASGYMSAKQASPPTVSQASAGNTLKKKK
jgi:hypothetical protein